MTPAPIPRDELSRLRALDRLGVLYTPPEERFDRITRMASMLLCMPIARISLVGDDFRWVKSSQGLDSGETSRALSFSAHAILADEPMVVGDALLDPRFADNPRVAGDPRIRCYAGQPIIVDGQPVGALCVMAMEPRQLEPDDLRMLRDLASLVEGELRLSALGPSQEALIAAHGTAARRGMMDTLTRCWNRRGIVDVVARELSSAGTTGLLMIGLDHPKRVVEAHGQAAGDAVIAAVAERIRGGLRAQDPLGRYGDDEFLVTLPGCGDTEAAMVAERMRRRLCGETVATPWGAVAVTISVGSHAGLRDCDPVEAVFHAAQALDRARRAGRNRVASSDAVAPAAPVAPRAPPAAQARSLH
jgi:diguanylate cyclase (GGDEF)-like protein